MTKHTDLQFAVITDLHVQADPDCGLTADQLQNDLAELCRGDDEYQFIIATGDLTQDGKFANLEAVASVFNTLKIPVLPVFGGHDGREEAKVLGSPLPWTGHYSKVFGPTWYSVVRGGCHLIVYANEDHHFTEAMNTTKRQWLRNELTHTQAKGLAPVVALHAPPTLELANELSRHAVALVICGHWHTLKRWQIGDTEFLCCPPMGFGGIDMMPRGYLSITRKTNGQLRATYRSLAIPASQPDASPVKHTKKSRKVADYFHRAAPVSADSNLFFSVNGDVTGKRSQLCCLDVKTGDDVWLTPIHGAIKHDITLVDDRLLANTQRGELLCLKRCDGSVIWSQQLEEYPNRWLHAQPIVSGDAVLAGTYRGGMQTFSVIDGRPLWQLPCMKAKPTVRGDVWPWRANPIAIDDDFVVPVQGHGVVRLAGNNGKILWQANWSYTYVSPSPLHFNSMLWLPSHEPHAVHRQIGVQTGRTIRETQSTCMPMAWTLHGQHIYLVGIANLFQGPALLQCLEAKSAELVWQQTLGHDPTHAYPYSRTGPNALAAPVVCNGCVIQSCTDGQLRMFNAQSGRPLHAIDLKSPLFASPVVNADQLWVTTWSGRIICVSLPLQNTTKENVTHERIAKLA